MFSGLLNKTLKANLHHFISKNFDVGFEKIEICFENFFHFEKCCEQKFVEVLVKNFLKNITTKNSLNSMYFESLYL